TSGGLGAGLPGVKRLMDEFDVQSEVGVGTKIKAIKWAR
ncbi:ATP-binding protein, partial [Virgibacillus halodenitrificans]|nr:ATP-binding protein [Virgibacillus halodenitrificans]MYL61502.1 ATP-binding protein [Virgibacillus halodenitrificans]